MSTKFDSRELENSLLGLLLSSKNAQEQVIGKISHQDFFSSQNKEIMLLLEEMFNSSQSIDSVTVIEGLKRKNKLSAIGGVEYIDELLFTDFLDYNCDEYIKLLKNNSKMREIELKLFDSIKFLKKSDLNAKQLVTEIESRILETTRSLEAIQKDRPIQDILGSVVNKIKANYEGVGIVGIETGFTKLNEITSGLHSGDFIVLAARPAMGKTAFALSLALNISENHPIAFFSLEMPAEHLAQRMISSTAIIDSGKLRKPQFLTKLEWEKIYEAQEILGRKKIIIDETPGIKLAEILWKARKFVREDGAKAIIVDYLQLITNDSKSSNRQEEVSSISRALKSLARELNVPIIALAQLSRSVEKREDKKPLMSDIRESGSIEQDADLIIFLYREGYYNRKEEVKNDIQTVDLILSKHRNGPTGIIKLLLEMNTGKFTSGEI